MDILKKIKNFKKIVVIMSNLKDLNLDDLFNMSGSIENFSTEPAKKKVDENVYSVNLADATDGVYRAKVRFLPNIRNMKKSVISKYNYWLTDANGENGIFVDDPSTIGEKSPIGDLFWKLKKSSNPIDVNLSDKLKRGRRFFSLVQIVEDNQHKEYEGKIMVFGYGIKIKEKIDAEFNDVDEGGNPFDLFNGRIFRLEVKKVGGFQNYDSCRFIGGSSPIVVDGMKMTSSKEDKAKIVDYLETSPDLSEYEFKPWSAELREQVDERLRTFKSGGRSSVPTAAAAPTKNTVVEKAISQDTYEEEDAVEEKSSKSDSFDDDFLAGIDL